MNKGKILAVGLIAAIGAIAIWLARDPLLDQGDVASPSADMSEPIPESADLAPDANSAERTAANDQALSAPAAANGGSVVRLFSELSESTVETLDASTKAQEYMNEFLPDYYVERSRIVRIDVEALNRLKSVALVNHSGLNETFDLTIFPDRPCTFSSLRDVSKREDGSLSFIYARCDNLEMTHNASISFNRQNGEIVLLYSDRETNYEIASLKDSDFAVALSLRPSTNSPLTGH